LNIMLKTGQAITGRPNDPESVPGSRRGFTDLLVAWSLIDRNDLRAAADHAERARLPLHDAVVDLGLVSEVDSYTAVAQASGIAMMDLNEVSFSPLAGRLVPEKVARRHSLVPLHEDNHTLTYAIGRPFDHEAERDVEFASGRKARGVLATRSQISVALDRCYPKGDEIDDLMAQLRSAVQANAVDSLSLNDAPDSPVVAVCNEILTRALDAQASDIHIEPFPEGSVVRYRISGIMERIFTIPREASAAVVNRLKIMSGTDIVVRHKPQDGSFRVHIHGHPIDIRLSTLPTIHGEKVVMRMIDSSSDLQTIDKLGYDAHLRDRFHTALSRPDGLILFTGPTASGKTTALYAALNKLRTGRTNIVSVEDPVERLIEGVNQIPVSSRGTSFASVLRSVLRQDPNIIMVGEIRDSEVAQIVGQAACTGHLVLSSLHTIDAASVMPRLRNLGIEPHRIAESLVAVFAQRLVRQLCPECRVQLPAGGAEQGKGCPRCKHTGYIQRVPVAEALVPDEALRAAIRDGAGVRELRAAMRSAGCRTMREVGLDMVRRGTTSVEEVNRVLASEDAEAAPKQTVQPREQEPNRQRILVVDDDDMMRALVGRLLAREGYDVVEGSNGHQAVTLARENRPDLLIMDLAMPEMDGYEAISQIRSDSLLADLSIMIVTAASGVKPEQRVLELGADDYLVKPFDPSVLLLRVRALFRRMQRAAA
jgi:type IV pilus assembly protein PilB